MDSVHDDEIQPRSWCRQIGYVAQETLVFGDNAAIWKGDPNGDRTLMQRVREAARPAFIAHFIDELPRGYDTLVGDRGVHLSGGRHQRLFIAREPFCKPSLLIRDFERRGRLPLRQAFGGAVVVVPLTHSKFEVVSP